jgi:hypothetical protein
MIIIHAACVCIERKHRDNPLYCSIEIYDADCKKKKKCPEQRHVKEIKRAS